MRETAFQSACIKWIEANYPGRLIVQNNHSGGYTNKGFPDLTIFGGGRAIVVELKSDSGYSVQEDQAVWRNRFLRIGQPHYVISHTDLDAFKDAIRKEFGHENV